MWECKENCGAIIEDLNRKKVKVKIKEIFIEETKLKKFYYSKKIIYSMDSAN